MSDADLIVVGSGPVRLACAIEARLLGMDVLVVEPRSAPIDKACGEGLMPGSLAALQRLGVDPPGRTLAGIAYLDAASRVEHRFEERPGRGVRRTVLHSALAARAAELGAHTLHDRVTGVASASSGTTLTLGRGQSTLSAPWVIAADGLHSPLRRLLELGGRPQPKSRRRFGVRRHYTVEPWTDLVEVHWSPTAEVYVTPVDDRIVGVAVLGPRPIDQEAVIRTVPALAAYLDGAPPASDPRGAGPCWNARVHAPPVACFSSGTPRDTSTPSPERGCASASRRHAQPSPPYIQGVPVSTNVPGEPVRETSGH
ncbi:oxidoreductase [Leifsonia xyli subsp. cynodontis DSM 46306]|uniref:FAD-binding domain-containing protein n=1 Tax=Leifsonia xyli subsp. cynodontis DSM 46306 TaxID=1389489 RepID=U3P3K6_LEIXC|nr:NAD(P)/FAD-dependent oxidoreductase [Leifsonia xyli]AGW40341.1 oxidoreductase [Leifsonia xyli subsp. cynodontis DSM 46306]